MNTMKETVKDLVRRALIGIGIAMVIFCLMGIVFDIRYQGSFRLENYRFTKMMIACALVGMGFGMPSMYRLFCAVKEQAERQPVARMAAINKDMNFFHNRIDLRIVVFLC